MNWSTMNLCECGCGKEVRLATHRFIHGHQFKGKHHTQETVIKMSESGKIKIFTEEHKKNLSESKKGNTNSLGHRHTIKTIRKMSNSHTGLNHSEEHKENISNGNKGRIVSENTKLRIRLSKITNGMKGFRNTHKQFKKQECVLGCSSRYYDLHHEPKLTSENSKEWNGILVNLCKKCHYKIHHGLLILPPNSGTSWTIEQTNEYFGIRNENNP